MRLKNLSNIKWIGGKHGKEERYLELMPKHRIFADVFFGSGAVTFYKETVNPADITVVNDINDRLVNYMMVIKNNPGSLYKECSSLPYSESLYEKWKWEPWPEDKLQSAVRFYYLMRVCFGGFKREDHIRLNKILENIKGKAMVCYYPDPLIDELYSGWYRNEYHTASQIRVRTDGDKCPVRTELILMNYKPEVNEQLKIV